MNAPTYEEAMRRLHAERGISPETRERLRALESWMFSRFNFSGGYGLTYHTCRFCKRGHPEVKGLWKYGVRHYACDDCRNDAIGKGKK